MKVVKFLKLLHLIFDRDDCSPPSADVGCSGQRLHVLRTALGCICVREIQKLANWIFLGWMDPSRFDICFLFGHSFIRLFEKSYLPWRWRSINY